MRERATIPRVCATCGAAFMARPSRIRLGEGRFCSHPCFTDSRRSPTPRETQRLCETCAKPFMARVREIANGNGRFCSHRCMNHKSPGTPILNEQEGTALIPLFGLGDVVVAHAIVDLSDSEWLSQWRWCLSTGYASRNAPRGTMPRQIRMHRLVLGLLSDDPAVPDHINRNKLDNRRSNLRAVTLQLNAQNKGARGGSSKYRGVSWNATAQKWAVHIRVSGKSRYFGSYLDEADAAEVARSTRARLLPGAVD